MTADVSNNKTALVTGATGFVGSHITHRLISEGWTVHVIALPADNFTLLKKSIDRITVHTHDGSTANMNEIVSRSRPSIVFHLASLFLSQHGQKDIEPLVRSNVLFGAQLLDALVLYGCHRFVNTGTSWQHCDNREYSPANLYAATKQAFEDILQYYVEATPLQAITLKLFDTYGPDDPRPKLFTLLRKTAAGQQTLDMSPGEQLIDLVYIDDIVHAFLMSAQRLMSTELSSHEHYAVSSGNPLPLRDLVALYASVIKKDVPIRWGGRSYRPREVMVPWNTGNRLPGWEPKIGLAQGIRLMEDSAA